MVLCAHAQDCATALVTMELTDHQLPATAPMDLSSLLAIGGDSPVLQALSCIGDDIACLRCLRQVSKEVGRHALLAVRKYTLTLRGEEKDTNVSGASLLQRAKLSELVVHLRLTGTCGCDQGVTTLILRVEFPITRVEQTAEVWSPDLSCTSCSQPSYDEAPWGGRGPHVVVPKLRVPAPRQFTNFQCAPRVL